MFDGFFGVFGKISETGTMSNLLRRFTSQGTDYGTRSVSGGSSGGGSGGSGGSSVLAASGEEQCGSMGKGGASETRGSEHGNMDSMSKMNNSKSLSQTISFSDFSMHVMDEEEHVHGHVQRASGNPGLPSPPRIATKPVAIPGGHDDVTSLDAELSNLRIHTKGVPASPLSKSLGIPSVASIFGTPKVGVGTSGETPRSSLDLYDTSISSAPTPTRTSADGEESVPVSPRSPKTPGGRRRKQKINGLDSFEWLELVRGSSL